MPGKKAVVRGEQSENIFLRTRRGIAPSYWGLFGEKSLTKVFTSKTFCRDRDLGLWR